MTCLDPCCNLLKYLGFGRCCCCKKKSKNDLENTVCLQKKRIDYLQEEVLILRNALMEKTSVIRKFQKRKQHSFSQE